MSISMQIWQSLDATMVLINSKWREEFSASSSSTSHLETIILWILRATYFEISTLSSNEEKLKISSSMLHHVFSMRFSTIVECFPTIKFWLLCMKEYMKLCIWLRKCSNFRRMGMKYIVDLWHQQRTLLNNQQVSGRFELGLQCLKGAVWWAEDSERAHWLAWNFAIPESAATEVVGVYIVCLSLIF